MQRETIKLQRYEFQVGAAAEYFGDHRLIFDRVKAARGVHQVPPWNKESCAPGGDFNLHFEHLPPLLWCPIPPNVSVFSRCCGARARHVGDHGIETGRREPTKMAAVVLGDDDVSKPQATSVADQHVESAGDGFVGNHHAFRMKSFTELSGFRTRRSAHVQGEDVLFGGKQAHGKHACRFLSGNSTCFVKQSHHSVRQPFRSFTASKRHKKRCLGRHPWEFNCSDGLDLFNGPLSVRPMKRDSKGLREWFKRCVQPNVLVPAQMVNQSGKRGLLSVCPPLLIGVGWSSHVPGSAVLSFGLPP